MREDCQLDAGKEIMVLRWGGGPSFHQRIYKYVLVRLSASTIQPWPCHSAQPPDRSITNVNTAFVIRIRQTNSF